MEKKVATVAKKRSEGEYKELLERFSPQNIIRLNNFIVIVSDYLEMNEWGQIATHIENRKFEDAGLTRGDIDNILAKLYSEPFSVFSHQLVDWSSSSSRLPPLAIFFPKKNSGQSGDPEATISQETLDAYRANFENFKKALTAITSSQGTPQGVPLFNTKKSKIVWGPQDIHIVPNTNQFMFCAVMFEAGPGVPIEYPDIIDAELGVWDDEGKDPQKSVYDVMRTINKKIKGKFGVEALFSTSKGTFIMNEGILRP